MEERILVFDIGGSAIKCGIWESGTLKKLDHIQTPDSWEDMQEQFLSVFNRYNDVPFNGVGISCPGAVDTEKGVINGISAVPYIHRFPIKKAFEQLFGLPVSIQNDANCAGLAELWKGNARNSSSACCLIIGSGIGGAVIIDGKLHSGHNLFGGEFGYQIIDSNSLTTLSEVGSPVTMAKNYTTQKADGTVYNGEDVFKHAEDGDELAEELTSTLFDALSLGIYNLLVSINPERILIGGGISKNASLIPELKSRTENLLKDKGADELEFEIKECKFLNDSNLIGAAYQYVLENA